MNDEEMTDRQVKLTKFLHKFVSIFIFVNLVLGIVNSVMAFMEYFNHVLLIASITNLLTVMIISTNSYIFQKSLSKKFSGSYIKNVNNL